MRLSGQLLYLNVTAAFPKTGCIDEIERGKNIGMK
jgi:hypothetical protein